ncbi:head completion/stabilization protein [Sphingomonas cavernae]|uniref:Head completion/stabilization protein n=1 Tax=Sphingomonas cavernae TaxID=2320861 RepID=A0A418WP12_9SPHN|nr:head completion/stabilization protein [Sphingomonas cavernae]RJF92977.1 head completion/stabilization protein [Sphingomonas cavernae]
MSGLISIVSPPADPDAPAPEPILVEADGWFPAIDLTAMRAARRLDDTITTERLRDAVRNAMATVMNDLLDWQGDQIFAGHASLEAVPSPDLDGESRLLRAWTRAVYCYARAELVEEYADYDATGSGERKGEDLDPAPGKLRRDGLGAIRDILGKPRTLVESI